jgi:heme-degrading monooxygenase HmoA
MSAVTKLLAKFAGVKKTSSGWSARCPAHEDRQASLSIGQGDDGRVLLKCHAGCGHKKIVAALGLEERDLFDADATPTTTKKSSSSKPATKASKAYTFVSQAQEAYERTLGKPTRSWEYRDPVTLEPVGRVLRWDRPEGEKEIRPLSLHADGWRLEHMVEPRPLYGVEFLEDADRVYVVEGEKCCDALFLEGGLGLASTTSSGGSNAARQTDWSPLAGREVVILPDNDDPGRKYAADVAAILHELDPPATVRVVELDGMDKGGDVADLYEACRDEEELKALCKKIERLAGETEPLKPKATPSRSSTSSSVEAYKPFPVDALPEPLAAFVAETAAAIGCDPAYVALPLVVVAGAAIGTTRRLELKYKYEAPVILWSVIVGESGTSKSPALRSVLEHVRDRERRLREEYAVERREYEAAVEAYEKERAAWRSDKKSGGQPPDRPAEPVGRRALVSDTTVEALALKLADNPRGLLLARDELAGWLNSLDRYANKSGSGSDESFYLSCYNAEPHTVDRRTGDRREIHVSQAGLWIVGGIQPQILQLALGTARRQSGLLSRLLLVAPPPLPAKWSEREVSPLTRRACHDVLDRLYELEPDADAEGRQESRLVRLTADAKKSYVEWHDRHAEEAVEKSDDEKAAWSKLRETVARLALVIHEVRLAAGDAVDPDFVDAASVARAIRLVEWQKYETRRVYALLAESEVERATRLADDRLAAFVIAHGGSVAVRDVIAGVRSIRDADAATDALQRLVDAGRGFWCDKPTTDEGGRPGRLFVLIGQATSAQPPKLPALQGCADADAGRRAERQAVANEDYVEL